ncbi:MAG: RNA ligase family protein [Polyangiaceae bacterium]|nr:RNA ligase family protein [Polyangiaceae bacterium]MCW5790271.1 RNA ligase family protein [Polyangiaceae bacterium]
MSDDFFRFPHTPHVAWLGKGSPRSDKVLARHEVSYLLSSEVIVEEKIDGANLGFSVGNDGALRAQNRGSFLDLDAPKGQWKPLKRWLASRRHALADALAPNLMLFGEWCYAVHSVRYTRLPDWFLAFDVYDRARKEFWDVERRNALAKQFDVLAVPELGRGKQTVESLTRLLGQSQLTEGPAEGLYVRREENGMLTARAKLVRAEFVQAIDEHWSKRAIEENQLAGGTNAWC